MAKEDTPYLRAIEGQKTLLSRTMHDFAFDELHDEIYVSTPDQLILVFDRLANGNVAPKRVLGGPDTQLSLGHQNTNEAITSIGPEWNVYGGGNGPRLRIDPIHNLLFVPSVGAG